MSPEDVRVYYSSGYKACKSIGIRPQNFAAWKKKGHIPIERQFQFEKETKGVLKADQRGYVDNE